MATDAKAEPRIHEKWPEPAHRYEIEAERELSRLVAGACVETGRRRFRCVGCGTALPDPLSHGDRTECQGCGLGHTLHGNGFTIDGQPDGD